MNIEDKNKQTNNCMKPYSDKQILVLVEGCKVKLNFPVKPEDSAISDIKRMMLGGVVKT